MNLLHQGDDKEESLFIIILYIYMYIYVSSYIFRILILNSHSRLLTNWTNTLQMKRGDNAWVLQVILGVLIIKVIQHDIFINYFQSSILFTIYLTQLYFFFIYVNPSFFNKNNIHIKQQMNI